MVSYLPTSLIFIGFSVATSIFALINRREKIEKKILINEMIIGFLFLNAGISFPFLYQSHSPGMSLGTLNTLWALTSFIFVLELIIWTGVFVYNAVISKKDPELMAARDYNKYRDQVMQNWVDDLKGEFGRKILHLFTVAVIFVFWTIGTILDSIGFLNSVGLDNYSFSYWWTITVGLAFVIMFAIADLVRLNKSYMLPNWARNWYLSMRPEELDTFIASTPLVLALVPFIFAPFPILGAVALITTAADGLACIIGKKYGKHPLRKNSEKTVEGFIAGASSTFLIVIVMMILYQTWMPLSFIKILMMALVAMILFMIIDMFISRISDNILNPIFTGFGMWLIYVLV